MDTANDAEAVPGLDEPRRRLSAGAVERATSSTPVGIKSSPPVLSSNVVADPVVEDASTLGDKSDSDAETLVIPGANGYSPSKIRKTIKLEDKSAESGALDDLDDVEMAPDGTNSERSSEGATSNLGKRKRSKHGNASTRHEHSRNGNSSGLSSILTSPVATARSSLSKPAESDSDISKSPSPGIAKGDTVKSKGRRSAQGADHEVPSADEKEQRRTRRRRSSGLEVADKRKQRSIDPLSSSYVTPRNDTRSTSPPLLAHRRSASSNSAATGPSHKKKKLPAPLRATRDRQSIDERSDDDSSVGESPHPRRSRTRNLATPPTGDSSISLAKMPPHKKRNPFGRTDLADACEDGDLIKARKILLEKPGDLDVADAAGNTPLQCASLNGYVDVVKMLLEAGCNIHCLNNKKDSPLLDAVENGHLKVVKLLLAAGVNPKVRNEEGEEPIDKVDDSGDDAEAIREALRKARVNAGYTQPSAPVHSPHAESYSSRSRRTQSHGRSTKTGDHQLYTSYTVEALRSAAAKGDLQTVGNILQVIVTDEFDDPESLVVAARGGHDEVLQILLGFGNADPDPPPLGNKDWEHATPMLAAIGSDNIKVIELLLAKVDDDRFDPSKRYHGATYYELARQRMGPLWEEEERILKEAYDKYISRSNPRHSASGQHGATRGHHKKLSDSDARLSSAKSKAQGGSGTVHGVKREPKGATSSSVTPVKRGPGRPRKEGHEQSLSLDRDSNASVLHKEKSLSKRLESEGVAIPSDTEPMKPRRKLISGKEMKGEREKQRRASVASIPLPGLDLTTGEVAQANLLATKAATPRLVSSASEPDNIIEKTLDRARSIKREDSKDRLSAIRGESPAKRPRKSSTPPSETHESSMGKAPEQGSSHKRRRLESDGMTTNRSESGRSISPDRKITPGTLPLSNETVTVPKDKSSEPRNLEQKSNAKSLDLHKPQQSRNTTSLFNTTDATRTFSSDVDSHDDHMQDPNNNSPPMEKRASVEQKPTADDLEMLAKVKRAKEEREREQAEQAEQARLEIQQREREAAVKREHEQQEELKRQDLLRREEQRKAEEERRRVYDEQLRQQREQEERRKAARREEQRLEHQRLQQEKEAMRLAKLPPLLRWFDGLSQPATRDFAYEFRIMQGVRYDTINPDASGKPDAKEQWLLNTQVALLLGEKDLQLSRYTAWERIPVSQLAKKTLWKVESERYAMITATLKPHNRAFAEMDDSSVNKRASYNICDKIRGEAESLFLALELFFVKVSDFMFIVPKFSHLRNLELQVQYREIPPDDSWLYKLTFPTKWQQDVDADINYGFAPGAKHYVNGNFMHEEKPKVAQTSKTPFPEQRVPRIGLRQVFSSDPDYEKICLEQGLEHLLQGRGLAINGHAISLNGQMGITPPESTNGEPHRPSDASSLGLSIASHEVLNGINGTL